MSAILTILRQPGDAAESTHPLPTLDRLDADSRAAGLDVDVHETGTRRPVAPAIGLAAYRIAQESLTNARRHGTGYRAVLRVGYEPDTLTIEVINDAGPASAEPSRSGHGVIGMRERVAAAGTVEVGPISWTSPTKAVWCRSAICSGSPPRCRLRQLADLRNRRVPSGSVHPSAGFGRRSGVALCTRCWTGPDPAYQRRPGCTIRSTRHGGTPRREETPPERGLFALPFWWRGQAKVGCRSACLGDISAGDRPSTGVCTCSCTRPNLGALLADRRSPWSALNSMGPSCTTSETTRTRRRAPRQHFWGARGVRSE
jgi:hypothetical protein